MNTLYYGDNLDVLRRHIDDESVDLIYGRQPDFPATGDIRTHKKAPKAKAKPKDKQKKFL